MAKYINPYTDFGFKKLFGEEGSKEQLKDFLNELLPPIHKIKELSFKQSEQLGDAENARKAIFDIYCEAENGTKFIVEMQTVGNAYMRSLRNTFPIKEQAEKDNKGEKCNWRLSSSSVAIFFIIKTINFLDKKILIRLIRSNRTNHYLCRRCQN